MSELLRVTSLDKSYDGVTNVLEDVALTVERGSVHAIVGENGAGKSTVAHVIAGMVPFDAGVLTLAGNDYAPSSPRDAVARGVGIVHQRPMLFSPLTVAENVVLGSEPGPPLRFDRSAAEREVRELSDRYDLPLDPKRRVRDLSAGDQQRVEILRALHGRPELLILDEPTAVLAPQEVDDLFALLRRLVDDGLTVILIAHKLEEVLEVADTVTVLRRGRVVANLARNETSRAELVRLMVGGSGVREVELPYGSAGEPVLVLRNVSVARDRGDSLAGIDLTVRAGEIVGIAGVEGNGQSELELVLGGLLPVTTGTVTLAGADITRLSPRARSERGLAHIPSERLSWGAASSASVFDNGIARAYRDHTSAGLLQLRKLRARLRDSFARFDVRAPSLQMPASELSGGNVQRMILARELSHGEHKVIVAATPTRGLDVRGVEYVHSVLRRYRDAGAAVLLISTDLDEVIALSDRIGVMYRGALVIMLEGKGSVGKEELGAYMLHGSARAVA